MHATLIESEQYFYYDTKNLISATSLAESLKSYDALVRRSSVVIGRALGVRVKETEIFVTEISIGSYQDTLLYRLICGKGRAGEKKFEEIRKAIGLKNMDTKKIIALLIAGAVLYTAWQFIPEKKTPETIHIENSFNNIGTELGLSRDDLFRLYGSSFKNPEELKKIVSRLTHPGDVVHEGSMTFDKDGTVKVDANALAVIPSGYVSNEGEEPFKDFTSIELEIRAVDLDRPDAGWAGIIPSVSEKRLPVAVAEDISPAAVPVGRIFEGDVTVIYRITAKGERMPKRYMLRHIHEEKK